MVKMKKLEETLNASQLRKFRAMVQQGINNTAIGHEFGFSCNTVKNAKIRLCINSELEQNPRSNEKPKPEITQRKTRKCNACKTLFVSEHFGNRNCGCTYHYYSTPQEMYA